MPPYLETAEDLSKKYNNTFIKYNGKVAWVGGIAGDPINGFVATISWKGSKSNIPLDPTKIENLIFDSGFINVFEHVGVIPITLFLRNPRRQWKRGLSEENCRIICPLHGLYRTFGKKANGVHRLSYTVIETLLEPKYPTITEALGMLDEYRGVAVSPMFGVTLSSISTTKALLCSPFGFIGEVGKDVIQVYHQPAFQEVRDFIFRTKQHFHVEVADAN